MCNLESLKRTVLARCVPEAGICWNPVYRNLFEILLNQLEIRLYLPFSDWLGTKRTSVCSRCWDVLESSTARLKKKSIYIIILKKKSFWPFSDWFGTKRTFVWIQINRKIVNRIWFRVDLIRYLKDISACRGFRYNGYWVPLRTTLLWSTRRVLMESLIWAHDAERC